MDFKLVISWFIVLNVVVTYSDIGKYCRLQFDIIACLKMIPIFSCYPE